MEPRQPSARQAWIGCQLLVFEAMTTFPTQESEEPRVGQINQRLFGSGLVELWEGQTPRTNRKKQLWLWNMISIRLRSGKFPGSNHRHSWINQFSPYPLSRTKGARATKAIIGLLMVSLLSTIVSIHLVRLAPGPPSLALLLIGPGSKTTLHGRSGLDWFHANRC